MRKAFLFFLVCLHHFSYLYAYNIDSLYPSSSKKSFIVVFCPLHYHNKDLFLKDIEGIKKAMFSVIPFNEFYDKISVYYISLTREEERTYFRESQGLPPVKVRRDFLDTLSAKITPYKLVIIDYTGSVSCAELSKIDKVSLIILGRHRYLSLMELSRGFLHELGHSLGLRDECVECAKGPPGYPNCAPDMDKAKEWWGDMVGKVKGVRFIQGCCGDWNCIRPTPSSLMNDARWAGDFGPVNERYLRRELSRFLE